ncbi:MAG: hypothetical protein WA160_03535 [Pseudobdellovibrio sp.]
MMENTNKKIRTLILAVGFILFSSCSVTTCKIEDRPPVPIVGNETTMNQGKDLTSRVRVYKPDGTLQCSQGAKIELSVMKKELTDIQVFSAENKHDGLMRVQMCGHPTGTCNVYEILSSDLDKALKLGFKKWNKD